MDGWQGRTLQVPGKHLFTRTGSDGGSKTFAPLRLDEEGFSQAEASPAWIVAGASTGLLSSRSMAKVISSLAVRPPPANSIFHFMPHSLRFTLPRRLNPAL